MFGNAAAAAFSKNFNFFFLLKFNMVCMFWIVGDNDLQIPSKLRKVVKPVTRIG
jgi:hypothetical protein